MTPQIILFLDASGALCAEAPSANGTRNKIDLGDWTVDDLPLPIADALFAQLVASQEAEHERDAKAEREALARRKRFFQLSYEKRVLGEQEFAETQRRKRRRPS
jgi:hypothetical protein